MTLTSSFPSYYILACIVSGAKWFNEECMVHSLHCMHDTKWFIGLGSGGMRFVLEQLFVNVVSARNCH